MAQLAGGVIVSGEPIFPAGGSTCPTGNGCGNIYNLFSVSQKFRNAYNYNYNLNVEKAIGRPLLLQVGYVGSAAHRLLTTQDINQAALDPSGNLVQSTRPYFSQFPDFGIINEIGSNANSNYNSLQTVSGFVNGTASRLNSLIPGLMPSTTSPPIAAPLRKIATLCKGDYGTAILIHVTTHFAAKL